MKKALLSSNKTGIQSYGEQSSNKTIPEEFIKALTLLWIRQQKALHLRFIASKLHIVKKWIYFTYLTIKAVIALIVTVLHYLEP